MKGDRLRASARRAMLLAGSAAAIVGANAARAADLTEVDELVVTGHIEETLPSELSRYGNRLVTITEQRLQDGGYVDVGQALEREVPGLSLIPQSGPFSYNIASLQGSRTGEILYLVDGVRISNRLYATTPPLDTIPAHMVQRIEVLQGGQGLFFGTQAVAGVINIVTKQPQAGPSGRVEIGGDTNDAVTGNAWFTGGSGAHRLAAFASYDWAKGFRPFRRADYQPSATDRERGYRLTSLGGKYAFEPAQGFRFSASYTHTEGYVDFARPVQAAKAVNYRNEEIAWAKIDWDPSNAFGLYIKGYWHDWESHYDEDDNIGGSVVTVSQQEIWTFHDYGLNAAGRYVLQPGLELWGGYEIQKYGGHDDVLIIERRNETAHALFAQMRVTPEMVPGLHFAAGLRSNFIKRAQDATVFNVSGAYDLTDSLFVKATAGTAFRLPDAESLFANDPLFNGEVGNPNLKPERSKNLNASIGGRGDMFTWELVGFARETKDLISLDGETPDPDVFTFVNLPDKVRATGFEALASAQATEALSLRASYTHTRTRLKGSGVQLAGVPKDHIQAGFDFRQPDQDWGVGGTANYVGDVYDTVASGFGRRERGNYVVVDFNAWLQIADVGRLNVRLENAFGESYSTRITRATRDTGGAYLVHYRGVPRTLHVSFAKSF